MLGGINMHKGPIDQYMMDKGSRPGWTGIAKVGGYLKKVEFGLGLETGQWNYTNLESGYELYNYPSNYSGPKEPYGYKLENNTYTSVFAYFNYKLIDRKVFCSIGLTQGFMWVNGVSENVHYSSGRENLVTSEGNIPVSSGLVIGGQVILGYKLTNHIRLKVEAGARWGGYSIRHTSDFVTGYQMIDFPMAVGMVFHNFRLK